MGNHAHLYLENTGREHERKIQGEVEEGEVEPENALHHIDLYAQRGGFILLQNDTVYAPNFLVKVFAATKQPVCAA